MYFWIATCKSVLFLVVTSTSFYFQDVDLNAAAVCVQTITDVLDVPATSNVAKLFDDIKSKVLNLLVIECVYIKFAIELFDFFILA